MENEAVLINKFESIQKCINRINEEYEGNPDNLDDYRRMDAIVLNLQRACEAATDMAMYIVSNRKLGVPQTKKEAFVKLEENNLIDKTKKQEKVWNAKKTEWRYSRNPFKIIGSLFMDDEITTWRDIDGYYDTTELRKKIDAYLLKLQRECDGMGKEFEQILDNSKDTVQKLTEKLIAELGGFLEDIKKENEKIEKIRGSISELDKEIKIQEETQKMAR